jgi:hypothetical protein
MMQAFACANCVDLIIKAVEEIELFFKTSDFYKIGFFFGLYIKCRKKRFSFSSEVSLPLNLGFLIFSI